jgi:hypothetical protein
MPQRGARPNVHPIQRRILDALASLSSPLLIDDYLELINPLWSTRELRGRIEEINHETKDAATVLVKPGYRWGGHRPGQYLRIGLDIKGVRHWRAYSLTSDPQRPDGLISITVKNVDEGKAATPHSNSIARLRPALQQRAVPSAARHGSAHHPAARVPRWEDASQARSLPGTEVRRQRGAAGARPAQGRLRAGPAPVGCRLPPSNDAD